MKVLLTGIPGVGKTTVIKKIADALGSQGAGFYTEERREKGQRIGFDIVTLDGRRACLSRIAISSLHRVGRYGVDVNSIESTAVPAIDDAVEKRRIIIIDEIGKMELYSDKFRDAVMKAFDSPCHVLAVVMSKPNAFADSLKKRQDVELVEINKSNRDSIPLEIIGRLKSL